MQLQIIRFAIILFSILNSPPYICAVIPAYTALTSLHEVENAMMSCDGAYYSAERNGTPDSAKYLFCGTHRNGPKTASQLSGYYIEMYPKQVALIS